MSKPDPLDYNEDGILNAFQEVVDKLGVTITDDPVFNGDEIVTDNDGVRWRREEWGDVDGEPVYGYVQE